MTNFIDEDNIPSNLVPIDAPPIVPGLNSGNVPAPVPHDMPAFFSGSLPPQLQLSTKFDAAQVGTPRIPKTALMPFGPQANPSTNAAAQSTASKTVVVGGGSDVDNDDDTNPVDAITAAAYTVAVSDFMHFKTFNNASGGVITLPGTTTYLDVVGTAKGDTSGGVLTASVSATPTFVPDWAFLALTETGGNTFLLDAFQFTTGNSATASVSATPSITTDLALWFHANSAGTPGSVTPVPAGYTTIGSVGSPNFNSADKQLSSTATESPSVTINSGFWACGLLLIEPKAGSSIAFQNQTHNTSGSISVGNIVMNGTASWTKGNAVIFFMLADAINIQNSTQPSISNVTDTQGNTWTNLGTVVADAGLAGSNPGAAVSVWMTFASATGTANVTFTVTGGISGGGFSGVAGVYQFTGVGAVVPAGFTDITPGGPDNFHRDQAALINSTSLLTATQSLGQNAGTQVNWSEVMALFKTKGTPAVIQSASFAGTGPGPFTVVMPNPITVGNTLIVAIHEPNTSQGTVNTFTITDTQGDGYVQAAQVLYTPSTFVETTVFYAPVAQAGSNTLTITASLSNLNVFRIAVFEVSNLGVQVASAFPAGWWASVENIGAGTYNIVPNGATLDGAGTPVPLAKNAGLYLHFDGSNWFTMRGAPTLFNQTIEQAGVAKPQEPNLNFLSPITVTDNPSNKSSDVAVPVFHASGGSHSTGLVPDPGAVAGTTKFLREDATWQVPSGGGGGSTIKMFTYPEGFSSSGVATTNFNNAAIGGVANSIRLWYMEVRITLSVNSFDFYVVNNDVTNKYDFGMYDLSGNLIWNIGATIYGSTGTQSKSLAQGTVSISPGDYWFAWTGNGVGLGIKGVSPASVRFYWIANSTTTTPIWFSGGTSSGGALPATITAPSPTTASNLMNITDNSSFSTGLPIFALTSY